MRYMRPLVAVFGIAIVCLGGIAAEAQYRPKRPKEPLGNNPHPVIWGGQKAKPTPAPSATPSATPSVTPVRPRHRHHGHHRHGHAHRQHYVVVSYLLNSPWRRTPYYSGYYSYPYYYCPRVVAPPEADQGESPVVERAAQRATNAESIARSRKFIGYGDALFAKQKYAEANIRYRKASQAAPQLADPRFRQAFALAATGRYAQAVLAIQRGLLLDPQWPTETGFALDVLYLDNEAAKSEQLEALIAASDRQPQDADLMFLVGVHLYFDGQAVRAAPFFHTAAQLFGPNAQHVAAFQ